MDTNLWFLENVNLNELLCPVKSGPLDDNKITHHYKRGEFIYFPNELSEKIYFIDEGRVKIGSYSQDGKEIIKGVLGSGEIFGVLAIAGEERRKDFAQAMDSKVTLCERTVEEFKCLMMEDKKFSLHITKIIGSRLIRTERRLESLIFKDARTRIVDFLKELGETQGVAIGVETLVRSFLTHQEIANLTGTSRQTVTTVLNELREDNLIYFDRKRLLIRDLENLN